MTWLWIATAALALAGALLLLAARLLRVRSGLPAGDLLYSDTGIRQQVEKPLISRKLGLIGRPDYLVHRTEHGRKVIIPVEVKSGHAPRVAHPGHALQVGAYCLLVEEEYGVVPPYGLLRYADGIVPVPMTSALRAEVLKAAAAIRRARTAADVPRSHSLPERCTRCGYRSACGQALS